MAVNEAIRVLCGWFEGQAARLDSMSVLEQCEFLLCAHDLNVFSSGMHVVLEKLKQEDEAPERGKGLNLNSLMRQMVFVQFSVADENRKRFVDYWINSTRFNSQSLVTVTFLVDLALQNHDLVNTNALEYAKNWYIRHTTFKSDKITAWAPACLKKAGFPNEAEKRAQKFLAERERNGSWGSDIRRTISCAYAMAVSGIPTRTEMEITTNYITSRIDGGFIDDIVSKAQALKFLYRQGLIPEEFCAMLRGRLEYHRVVFISYSRQDIEFANQIRTTLSEGDVEVWQDVARIRLTTEWPEQLARAINECDVLLILVSKHSVRSEYFNKEIVYALKKKKPVIALHVDDAELPAKVDFMLGDIQHICLDYTNMDSTFLVLKLAIEDAWHDYMKR